MRLCFALKMNIKEKRLDFDFACWVGGMPYG
jgi:hypothetical protein